MLPCVLWIMPRWQTWPRWVAVFCRLPRTGYGSPTLCVSFSSSRHLVTRTSIAAAVFVSIVSLNRLRQFVVLGLFYLLWQIDEESSHVPVNVDALTFGSRGFPFCATCCWQVLTASEALSQSLDSVVDYPFLSLVAKQLNGLLRHAFRSFVKSCQLSSALLGGGATRTTDAELPHFPSQAKSDSAHYARVRLQVAEDVAYSRRLSE